MSVQVKCNDHSPALYRRTKATVVKCDRWWVSLWNTSFRLIMSENLMRDSHIKPHKLFNIQNVYFNLKTLRSDRIRNFVRKMRCCPKIYTTSAKCHRPIRFAHFMEICHLRLDIWDLYGELNIVYYFYNTIQILHLYQRSYIRYLCIIASKRNTLLLK